MRASQHLPRQWLFTDERLGDALFAALDRLPRGGGIVFRHYRHDEPARRRLFVRVAAAARRRRQLILLAGPPDLAGAWGADGSHGEGPGTGLRSAPVHDLSEIRAAERAGADFLFLSPVFPTASHPGAPALGPARFDRLAAATALPVIALGGMNERRWQQLPRAYGWAGIGAWTK